MTIVTLAKAKGSIRDCPEDEILGLMEEANKGHADFFELSGTALKKLLKSFQKNGINITDLREKIKAGRPLRSIKKGGITTHVASRI